MASAGADIVINDVNADGANSVAEEVKATGQRVTVKAITIADEEAVNRMIDEVSNDFGDIDILVNNAGVYIRHEGTLETMPSATWHGILETNLHGAFYCTRAVLSRMIPRKKGGKIVNISSVLAEAAHFEASSYHVSKAGINALTRCLAVELAPHKINVNAIAPGAIASEGLGGMHDAETCAAYRRRIPWGARGHSKDIGNVVAFLASDEARYITGEIIHVDGGYMADSTPENLKSHEHAVPPDDPDPT
jgi:NAD(P)-dependent dehydrogenase (short-subunit alcohol dehydrogenase family)